MHLQIEEIRYYPDSVYYFDKIHHRPYAIFLDSGRPYIDSGRFDILACDPICVVDDHYLNQNKNVFSIIKRKIGHYPYETDLPFVGGAIGFWSYELAWHIEKLPTLISDDLHFPKLCVGIFHQAIVVDHVKQQCWLISPKGNSSLKDLLTCTSPSTNKKTLSTIQLTPDISKDQYKKAFERIKQYIYDGDIYQTNLSHRFSGDCQGDSWPLYRYLRRINPAPYAAFMRTPEGDILSMSPEKFLTVNKNLVTTKPIKGTMPRSKNKSIDARNKQILIQSEKDRAENIMIVDLMRSDLSRTCEPGSVKSPHLCECLSYTSVHHLVSTVTGKLQTNKQALDLFKNCFPGGSITGAPKIRAMEISEEVETHRRHIFCGSMGYVSQHQRMDSNIIIRSLLHTKNKIYSWAGGGIVADSIYENEYQETLDKIEIIQGALKTFKPSVIT